MIQQACNDVSEWRQVAGFCDVAVAVNVSARQLNDDDITRAVRDALAANSLPAAALTLEITETALMGDEEQAKATVGQLHELGVRLAIDDFGTGYSSLSNLRKFHFDTLKIDRSFVAGLAGDETEDVAIIAAVVALAHSLGITVTGEGVGTLEQARKLAGLGCDHGQGYLWGGPCRSASCPEPDLAPRRGRRWVGPTAAGQPVVTGTGSASNSASSTSAFPFVRGVGRAGSARSRAAASNTTVAASP